MAVEQFDGKIEVRSTDGLEVRVTVNGDTGNITAGTETEDGDLVLRASGPNGSGGTMLVDRVHISAHKSELVLRAASIVDEEEDDDPELVDRVYLNAETGNLWVGGNGRDGDILLHPSSSTVLRDHTQATFHLDGEGGKLFMRDSGGSDRVMLSAYSGNFWLGGNGADGDILLFPASVSGGDRVANNASIHMDGDKGDIVLRNADCAEEFEVALAPGLEPGAVAAIADDGRLELCATAYDTRVAGIIAGAGDLRPGIVLGREPGAGDRLPVALMGRVNCQVDARGAPIAVGDLLTSSATPGHAMKAAEPARALGAIIGKALAPLDDGTGMIPVLVALQ